MLVPVSSTDSMKTEVARSNGYSIIESASDLKTSLLYEGMPKWNVLVLNNAVSRDDLFNWVNESLNNDVLGTTCYTFSVSYSAANGTYSFTFTYEEGTTPAPTVKPTSRPTAKPTATPTVKPTATPTVKPTATPTVKPTATPTVKPTVTPTTTPTATPTVKPTVTPTATPTATPTVKPTVTPTATPTAPPTVTPLVTPTVTPTAVPTAEPTIPPTIAPTAEPTPAPACDKQYNISNGKSITISLYLNQSLYLEGAVGALKSSSAAATVNGYVITAAKAGTAKITAILTNGKKVTVTVKITDPYLPSSVRFTDDTGNTIKKTTIRKEPGETYTVDVAISGTVSGYEPYTQLTYKSSNAKVFTVNGGVITPVGKGTATLTVTTVNGKKATLSITVIDPHEPASVRFDEGSTYRLSITTLDKRLTPVLTAVTGGYDPVTTYTWKTSSKKIVDVDQYGCLTPVKEGTATITVVTANGKKATIKVTVYDPYKATAIGLKSDTTTYYNNQVISILSGKTVDLTAILTPTGSTSTVSWKTSSSKIATLSTTQGTNCTVTGVAKGTATITATTSTGKKIAIKIIVSANRIEDYSAKPTSYDCKVDWGDDWTLWYKSVEIVSPNKIVCEVYLVNGVNRRAYKITDLWWPVYYKGKLIATKTFSSVSVSCSGRSYSVFKLEFTGSDIVADISNIDLTKENSSTSTIWGGDWSGEIFWK